MKEVDTFFKHYPLKVFKKGTTLIKSSEKNPSTVFYLIKGHVGQRGKDKSSEVLLNIFKPKSFFPLIFSFGKISNSTNFITLDQVEVRTAPVDKVIKFIKANPAVFQDVVYRFSRGMVGLLHHLETLISNSARQQIIDVLTTYAKRFGKKVNKHYKIDLKLTHKAIADNLGLSRETVSREINKLTKEQIVFKKGKYYFMVLESA